MSVPASGNRSFTRRGGRMPPRHHRTFDEHGPTYLVPLPADGTSVDPGAQLNAAEIFGRVAPLIVEIGSGSGDCIVAAAAARPEVDFLSVEVWSPGVAQTIAKAARAGLSNLRIVQADAAGVVASALPEASVQELWVFFPDPWPKKKHHKRRLVEPGFALAVARVLRPGGVWRLGTDWEDYAFAMREVLRAESVFENAALDGSVGEGVVDFSERFEGRVMTRFERKGLDVGHTVYDIAVRRLPTDQ